MAVPRQGDELRVVAGEIELVGGRLDSQPGNAIRSWDARQGWLLRLRDERGNLGLGEASPLPGYSMDSPAETGAQLRRWLGRRLPLRLAAQPPTGQQVSAWLADLPESFPAGRFALETALLDLIGQRLERSLASLLGAEPEAQPLRIAGLVSSLEPAAAVAEARAALGRGVETLKVKVGRPGAFGQELALLERLRAEFGPAIALRLDANGQLPITGLDQRLAELARFAPAWIEEPVSGFELAAIAHSPIPLAADETLQQPGAWRLLEPLRQRQLLAVVVLKPMTLGGSLRSLDLARRAAAEGIGAVVSHLFDGPVAFAASRALALALPAPRLDAGLDRHAGLGAWPAPRASTLQYGLGLDWPGEPR